MMEEMEPRPRNRRRLNPHLIEGSGRLQAGGTVTQSALGETTLAVPWGLRAEGSDQRSPRGPSLREAVPPAPPEPLPGLGPLAESWKLAPERPPHCWPVCSGGRAHRERRSQQGGSKWCQLCSLRSPPACPTINPSQLLLRPLTDLHPGAN